MKSRVLKVTIFMFSVAFGSMSIFIVFFGLPENISLNVAAYEYLPDELNNAEEVNVQIEGVHRRPLIGADTFTGRITIDKYSFTESYDMFDLSFEFSRKNQASLSYNAIKHGKPVIEMAGSIFLEDDKLDRFIIIFNESPHLGIPYGTTIAVPAQSHDEAVLLSEKIDHY